MKSLHLSGVYLLTCMLSEAFTGLNTSCSPWPFSKMSVNQQGFLWMSERSTYLQSIVTECLPFSGEHCTWSTLPLVMSTEKMARSVAQIRGSLSDTACSCSGFDYGNCSVFHQDSPDFCRTRTGNWIGSDRDHQPCILQVTGGSDTFMVHSLG